MSSLWSRVMNVIRGCDRVNDEIDEELEAHIAEAIAHGRDVQEAWAALGSALRHREASRDVRIVPWLDSLRADAIFGWRQLRKTPVASGAAVLSLALAIGACTAAFRLIDALLLRPLPINAPERLYSVTREGVDTDGTVRTGDMIAYPMFRDLRAAVKGDAELFAISFSERMDITYGSEQEIEKVYQQYVSGWMFPKLGIRAALGRVFTEDDDRKPGGHPYAVLSHDYWSRRFNRDRNVIGHTFRMGQTLYEIVGVAEEEFTGTEPGTMIDVFMPTMMHTAVLRDDWTWLRALALLNPGSAPEAVRARLHAARARLKNIAWRVSRMCRSPAWRCSSI